MKSAAAAEVGGWVIADCVIGINQFVMDFGAGPSSDQSARPVRPANTDLQRHRFSPNSFVSAYSENPAALLLLVYCRSYACRLRT